MIIYPEQNHHRIRYRRRQARRLWEWQYWSFRINRWVRMTRKPLSVDEAKKFAAEHIYGCAIEIIEVGSRLKQNRGEQ